MKNKYHCRTLNYTKTKCCNSGPPSSSSSHAEYFLAWFQSLRLPWTQPESPLALIPLVPESHVTFWKYVLNCEQNFSFFIFRSGLSDILINCNRISEGLLYELTVTISYPPLVSAPTRMLTQLCMTFKCRIRCCLQTSCIFQHHTHVVRTLPQI
jgi:hypothetical protein